MKKKNSKNKKSPNMSFQSEFNRIQDIISEFPDKTPPEDTVEYRLAIIDHRMTIADLGIKDLLKTVQKEISPIGLAAAKILYEEEERKNEIFGFLEKGLQYFVDKENLYENSKVVSQIIAAIASFGGPAIQIFSLIKQLAERPELPSRIQSEVVNYAFALAKVSSEVKVFAESLVAHVDESFRQTITIFNNIGPRENFNWDLEFKKSYEAKKMTIPSFEQKFSEMQKYMESLADKGPVSDDDRKSVLYRLVEYKKEVQAGKVAARSGLHIMQQDISPASLVAADVLAWNGKYNSQCLAFYTQALEYVWKTYGIAENSEIISMIIGDINLSGFGALKAFEGIKQLSLVTNLPYDIQDSIARYAFQWAYHSDTVYYFALGLKTHSDEGFRMAMEERLKSNADAGRDWEAEVKRELSYRGIKI